MGPHRDDSHERPLGGELAARLEAIVGAAEREARAAERAIEDRRRSAEDEVRRYVAAARLRVDAEAAGRAAKLEALGSAVRRLTDELTDATAALNAELRRGEEEIAAAVPQAPWPRAAAAPPAQTSAAPSAAAAGPAAAAHVPPAPAPAPPAAEPSNAARLVAIEMAVGGSSRADVEHHLRTGFGVADPAPLLDDVFGSESHAGTRLAWGQP